MVQLIDRSANSPSRPVPRTAAAAAAVSVLLSGIGCGKPDRKPAGPAAPADHSHEAEQGDHRASPRAKDSHDRLPPPLDDAPTKAELTTLLAELDAALDRRDPSTFWRLWEAAAMHRGERGAEFAGWLDQTAPWMHQSELLEYRVQGEFGIALVESTLRRAKAAKGRSSEPRQQWVVARRYRLAQQTTPVARIHLLVDHNVKLCDHAVQDGRYQCGACNFRFGAPVDSWLLAVGYQQSSDCVGNVQFFALGEDLAVSLSVMALADPPGAAETGLRNLIASQPEDSRWTAPMPFTVPGRPGTSARASQTLKHRVHDVELTSHGTMGYLISVVGDREAASRLADQIEVLKTSFAFVEPARDPQQTRDRAMAAYSSGGTLSGNHFVHKKLGIEFEAPAAFEPSMQTGRRLFCVTYRRKVGDRVERIVVSGLRAPAHEPGTQRAWLDQRIAEGRPAGLFEHSPSEWKTSSSTMLSMPIAKRTVVCKPTANSQAAGNSKSGIPQANDSGAAGKAAARPRGACFVHTRLFGDDFALVVEANRGAADLSPRAADWPELAELLASIRRPD